MSCLLNCVKVRGFSEPESYGATAAAAGCAVRLGLYERRPLVKMATATATTAMGIHDASGPEMSSRVNLMSRELVAELKAL